MNEILTDKESKIAFLLRYGQMKERVEILIERRKAYESDIYGIKSPVLSDMPKGTNIKTDLADKVVKLLSQTEDIDNELEALRNKMNLVKECIHRLKNYQYLSVLELKYIDGMLRKQIADIMGISLQSLDKRTEKAIKYLPITKEDLEKIL